MAQQRTGDEYIVFDEMPIGYSLRDYWAWNSSDLLSNTERGSFSEFVVSAALGLDLSGTRVDWEPFDVSFPYAWRCNGDARDTVRIEVKSCAYLQSWEQKKLSNILFSIRPAKALMSDGNYEEYAHRQSDVYVFCHYTQTVRSQADPLNLDDWDFYVISTRKLDDICGGQRTISLNSLKLLDPIKADYSGIRDAVVSCVEKYPPPSKLHNNHNLALCIITKQLLQNGAAFQILLILKSEGL